MKRARGFVGWLVPIGICIAAPSLADSPTPLPVVVLVAGAGDPIRVQVFTSARPRPCTEGSRLLDAMMGPGQSANLTSPTPCVCYRHTAGRFRKVDFGPDRIACWPTRFGDEHVLRITLVADK